MNEYLAGLVTASLAGEKKATGKLISIIEKGDATSSQIMEMIMPHTGNAYRIGITGPPGAGKSSLVNRLVQLFAQENYSVGVIAIDPSSPFSGGALLGDRVRMTADIFEHDVFFRSMSSNLKRGGLSRTTREAVNLLDASGRDIIIIETVGVGQSEIDVAQIADTILVVLVPESGDTIQLMKAGLMEIADIFVVNKSDRSGSEQLVASIQSAVEQSGRDWVPPVFKTIAIKNFGVKELYQGLWNHMHFLKGESRRKLLRGEQLRTELINQIDEAFIELLRPEFMKDTGMNQLILEIEKSNVDVKRFAQQTVLTWLQKRRCL